MTDLLHPLDVDPEDSVTTFPGQSHFKFQSFVADWKLKIKIIIEIKS